MLIENFAWPLFESFRDRQAQILRLEQWWKDSDRQPINLYGRRRTGKSWLFRRIAHGKPAVILISRKSAPGKQLSDFAKQLEPILGVHPEIRDVPSLFRILLRLGREQKILAIVDEFPYLLPRAPAAIERVLSAIAAVFEEELGESQTKLILCGSTVSVMASLHQERNPMFGRLTPLVLRPLPFNEARLFLPGLDAIQSFERFAIAGGMPRYLSLFHGGDIRQAVTKNVLDQNSPLYDEVKLALSQEFLQSGIHFSILELLATGNKDTGEIARQLDQPSPELTSYLKTLSDLGFIERRLPIGASPRAKQGQWHLADAFFAFWFRFVFPFQDDLENGLAPDALFDAEVAPFLNNHVSKPFEDWARSWTRTNYGFDATKVGSWWGNSLNEFGRSQERTSEEIDIVGIVRSQVTFVGEAKWTNKPMPPTVVTELDKYKIPAIKQAGFKVTPNVKILLLSKSGYATSLKKMAESDKRLILVDVQRELNRGLPTFGARPPLTTS